MATLSLAARLEDHVTYLTSPHAGNWDSARLLFWPWFIQFVMSWVGFSIYMAWDYSSWRRGTLESDKLPSRHPLTDSPLPSSLLLPGATLRLFEGLLPAWACPRVSIFWYSQLFMVPLVLFNQCVVWPLASLLVVWPQWALAAGRGGAWGALPALAALAPVLLVSDQLWYWAHRLMHTPWAWRHLHKMHHVAPQAAISATYVHPWEYTLFCLSVQLPFAIVGFPIWLFCIPLGWGMLTGSGAHSGYGGDFANGEKHGTGHHLYHSANFGLLMIADMIYGK